LFAVPAIFAAAAGADTAGFPALVGVVGAITAKVAAPMNSAIITAAMRSLFWPDPSVISVPLWIVLLVARREWLQGHGYGQDRLMGPPDSPPPSTPPQRA